jgi:hypothetical protein
VQPDGLTVDRIEPLFSVYWAVALPADAILRGLESIFVAMGGSIQNMPLHRGISVASAARFMAEMGHQQKCSG